MPNLEQYYRKKLDEIKAQPVKIFALVYPYVLIIGIGIGLLYSTHLSQVERTVTPAAVPDTTVQADLKVIEPRTVPPIDIMAASQPAPELVSAGSNIYTTVCQSCHGASGEGNGPGATGLNPPPRNFTQNSGWINGPKISQIYKTLEEGIPGSAMVAYDYLLPSEKIGLAHYIRQNFVKNPPQDTPDDLSLLDQTYQLSKGQEVSAQIPVAAAEEIMSKESAAKVQNIVDILSRMSADQGDEGAKIFNTVTNNKAKALTTLFNYSSSWKGNQQQFVNSIVNNINVNGFNGNVFKLSGTEWSALQGYVSKYF